MATLNANGDLQPEPEDILPREVARRDDDSPEIVALIEELNPTIETAEDLETAIEQVDTLRREVASRANQDNPHIARSVNESASKPQPETLGKHSIKSPVEL